MGVFTDLTDVPSSYSSEGGKVVQVNSGETGLEFCTHEHSFLDLTDTPASYSGEAGKGVRVNSGESALEFVSIFVNGGESAGANRTLGNTDSYSLAFLTNNSERLHITSGGRVGIGTSSPDERVHMAYGANFDVKLENTGDTSAAREAAIAFHHSNNEGARIQARRFSGESDGMFLAFHTEEIGGSLTERMRITDDGKVGIGETSPSTLLHIKDASDDVYFRIETDKADGQAATQFLNDARQWNVGVNTSDKFQIRDATAPGNRLVIDTSGNVGIGEDSPSSLLHVNGQIQIDNDGGMILFEEQGTGNNIRFRRANGAEALHTQEYVDSSWIDLCWIHLKPVDGAKPAHPVYMFGTGDYTWANWHSYASGSVQISSEAGIVLSAGGIHYDDYSPGDYVVIRSFKETTGDPTGVEGMIYWNTYDKELKFYCDGAWRALTASW